MIEQSLKVNNFSDLKYLDSDYKRIYLGNDKCDRLLPSKNDIVEIIAQAKNIDFVTFQIPQISTQLMDKVSALLGELSNIKQIDEIVVNDLGLIDFVFNNLPQKKVVLGTAFPYMAMKLYKNSELAKMGIERIETMSARNTYSNSKHISFHWPFINLSVSRYCPLADVFKNQSFNAGIIDCHRECLSIGDLEVHSSAYEKKMILRGNCLKVRSIDTLDKKEAYKIIKSKIPTVDRMVFEPY